MRVLIFYSETGGGHLRAAQALAQELERRKGIEVVLYDGLKKTNWGQKTNPSLVFSIISHYLLPIYNLNYKLADTSFGVGVLRAQIRAIWAENFRKIIEKEKPDLIVTTHHFISPSTAKLDQKIPFVVIVIDLGKPHRIWFDERADQIIVPNEKMAEWAKNKFQISDSKIKALGFPLKKNFQSVKKEGLTSQILMLGAGIRSNLVKKWIKEIRKHLSGKRIVVICGHNRILQNDLSKVKGIQTFGFINNLHQFLEKSDFVITKAGPASIMEAAALKKPMIIVKWVGLQEKHNIDFVVENNLGLYDPNGENLISSISKIYKNYEKYTNSKNVVSFDTDKIVNYLISLIH